ncbi:RHS repeat-associated core domain-containing protein [Pseudescherichia vulneris]|uniref:RHS repeat-associated core domain-containing protein n=1 Tax=Pseudescherichia vulneris TaxID=566 RepID=UPI0028D76D72|nr:RHS repeat-associated core domain-containing protein [Pseudescherichia vulneris]
MAIQLLGVNQNNSTQLAYDGSNQQVNLYSAFGSGNNSANSTFPGYNGERQDPLTGVSHLGNGYRAYNPILMRFNCPDNESPFGVGGINPYAYCENDPVNFTDPSGHGIFKWFIAGIASLLKYVFTEETAASVASKVGMMTKYTLTYGTKIASAITNYSAYMVGENNPQAAVKLEKASFAFGIIHVVTSTYSPVDRLVRAMKHLAPRGAEHLWEAVNKPVSLINEAGELKSTTHTITEVVEAISPRIEKFDVVVAVEEVLEEVSGVEINIFSTAENVDSGLSNTKLIYESINAILNLSSTGFSIASAAVREKNPQVAEDLSFISTAFGIANFGMSFGRKVHSVYDDVVWGKDKGKQFLDYVKYKRSIMKLNHA